MQRTLPLILLTLSLASCVQTPATPATAPAAGGVQATVPQHVLIDFESPESPVVWLPETAASPATEPSTQPTPLQRSSLRPHAGLWSMAMAVDAPGQFRYAPAQPLDLGAFDLLTAQVSHEGAPERNGECLAALRLTDADGHTVDGDPYPILSTWQPIPFDLKQAFAHDLDLARIASISLVITTDVQKSPLTVKTDTWATQTDTRSHIGSSLGATKSFYVESHGTRIHVGTVGQYDLFITDQGSVPAATPWLQVFSTLSPNTPPRETLAPPHTGLYLLDQETLALAPPRHTTADDAVPDTSTRTFKNAEHWSWPACVGRGISSLHWQVVWTSPVAAIIEGKQETGPFDRLGEPLLTANWRLMVYQWGQVFVDVRWLQTGESAAPVARPVSWALMSAEKPGNAGITADSPERLLTDIYPATFRQDLQTALPHRMQSHSAVTMIAPASRQKDNFWWARDAVPETRWIFGTGIATPANPSSGEATCMLLINAPSALAMAGAFGQYLVPPKIVVRQGELDRNFPGDTDNDGFVETYGFQVIRLANGRAIFSIYPQERPIFYPPILFTVPAVERDALDLKHSQLLINIDGKQFPNPPQFPDGSFLLQIPYVLDRPVTVEALLVK